MSTSFKRNDVQVYIENAQNCYDIEKWKECKPKLILWEVKASDMTPLSNCIESDLTSYFFKALESFTQALADIKRGRYSWAVVKLYYSIFYLLRCDILLSNHLIVRCSGLYYLKLNVGNKFLSYNKNNTRGDHQLTISIVKDLHSNGLLLDPILDNKIDAIDAYTWHLSHRERINYQQKNFSEPDVDDVFSHLSQYFIEDRCSELFDFYNTHDYSICFDLDHSILAIPYKKLAQIWRKSRGRIILDSTYKRKSIICLSSLEVLNIKKSYIKNFFRQVADC